MSSSATRFLLWVRLACFRMLLRSRVLYGHSRHANPSTMGVIGCGADPSTGSGTLLWSYVKGNAWTYCSTYLRNAVGVLCWSRRCRHRALGGSAYRHLASMHIRMPNSTFNAIKWLQLEGMGRAMPSSVIYA